MNTSVGQRHFKNMCCGRVLQSAQIGEWHIPASGRGSYWVYCNLAILDSGYLGTLSTTLETGEEGDGGMGVGTLSTRQSGDAMHLLLTGSDAIGFCDQSYGICHAARREREREWHCLVLAGLG